MIPPIRLLEDVLFTMDPLLNTTPPIELLVAVALETLLPGTINPFEYTVNATPPELFLKIHPYPKLFEKTVAKSVRI